MFCERCECEALRLHTWYWRRLTLSVCRPCYRALLRGEHIYGADWDAALLPDFNERSEGAVRALDALEALGDHRQEIAG